MRCVNASAALASSCGLFGRQSASRTTTLRLGASHATVARAAINHTPKRPPGTSCIDRTLTPRPSWSGDAAWGSLVYRRLLDARGVVRLLPHVVCGARALAPRSRSRVPAIRLGEGKPLRRDRQFDRRAGGLRRGLSPARLGARRGARARLCRGGAASAGRGPGRASAVLPERRTRAAL